MKPLVAILMAVHAGADPRHFAEALDSLAAQSWGDVRVYLWCDGPLTPAHDALVGRLSSGAVVLRSPSAIGLPAGLNRLVEHALLDPRIEFMARMDADDVCMPQRIERQVGYLQANQAIGICGTWIIEFTVLGVPLFHKRLPTTPEQARRFMVYRSPLAHPTVMFRRAVFARGHRYDPRLLQAQDYELWSRLLLAGFEIANVPEYLLWYRRAEGFYGRRAGWTRAFTEVKERWRYARRSRLMRPHHLLGLACLFLIRLAPARVKRLAYLVLR